MNMELMKLVFILDKSGSMSGLEKDTIGGFNSMIKKQKKENEKVDVTTVLFDSNVEIIHDDVAIENIKPLTDKEYCVGGCTALLDAIGTTIKKMTKEQKQLPDDKKAGKVLFVITTDGYENASKKYDYEKINKKINKRKKEGWEFLFLGANIDATKEASKIGIAANRAVTYKNDKKGVSVNFEAVGKAVRTMAECRRLDKAIDDNWADEIAEYNKN